MRRSSGRTSVTEQVREAVHAVHQRSLHGSKTGMKTKERWIHQYLWEKYGPDTPVPVYSTLRLAWRE